VTKKNNLWLLSKLFTEIIPVLSVAMVVKYELFVLGVFITLFES
jgi:hypothetical protein